ncbi:MAG: hypothetical protein GY820_06690 [Gammaproteobacteria bacterium]|nr:hypothetical protein [Gammaproteobacteria bacterium]
MLTEQTPNLIIGHNKQLVRRENPEDEEQRRSCCEDHLYLELLGHRSLTLSFLVRRRRTTTRSEEENTT